MTATLAFGPARSRRRPGHVRPRSPPGRRAGSSSTRSSCSPWRSPRGRRWTGAGSTVTEIDSVNPYPAIFLGGFGMMAAYWLTRSMRASEPVASRKGTWSALI